MNEDRRRILSMLAEGKITADEADELLDALGKKEPEPMEIEIKQPEKGKYKYLRINVEPKDGHKGDRVNIRIPIMLLKAGGKLASFIPGVAQDKISQKMKDEGVDIDLKNLDSKSLNNIIDCLGTMSIDVEDEKEKVKIYCE